MIRHLVVLALVAYVIGAALLFVVHHDDRPVRADAVVVLAGTKQRLPVGQRLTARKLAPLLVVSLSEPTSRAQAEACAGGRGYRVICFRADPFSTTGEAREIARLARTRGWRSIDVVTSQFHIVRARVLIRRCYSGRLSMVGAPESPLHLPVDVVRESAKLVYQEVIQRAC